MALICKRCVIEGRVQGVFFRAATNQKAQELGIHGWVRNMPDGRVESLLQGQADLVEQMMDWFWQGSRYSHVTSVQCYDEQPISTDTFKVTH